MAELKAAGKKLAKGGPAKPSSKKIHGARGAGVATTAAESAGAAGERNLAEKVHHGDFRGQDGKEGRWRACLAESGKVGFGCSLRFFFACVLFYAGRQVRWS